MPAWRPLAGLIRSLSAFVGRDPSQSCRARFSTPDRHRSWSPNRGWRWIGCLQGLHRATEDPRRQDPTRSKPLPQALPRPQPLPPTRTRAADRNLTDIEASLAQARPSPSNRLERALDRLAKPSVDHFLSRLLLHGPDLGQSGELLLCRWTSPKRMPDLLAELHACIVVGADQTDVPGPRAWTGSATGSWPRPFDSADVRETRREWLRSGE